MASKKIGNIVKFRFVTIVLWIKAGQKIPILGLKQQMWDVKRQMVDFLELAIKVYRLQGTEIQQQYIQSYQFQAFLVVFSGESLTSSISMPIINQINSKLETKTKAYAFTSSMYDESLLTDN